MGVPGHRYTISEFQLLRECNHAAYFDSMDYLNPQEHLQDYIKAFASFPDAQASKCDDNVTTSVRFSGRSQVANSMRYDEGD